MVERKKSGHVISGRSPLNSTAASEDNLENNSSPTPSRVSSRKPEQDKLSKTLPSSFTQRKSRPLKTEENGKSKTRDGKRSQTPSRKSSNTPARPSSSASQYSLSSSLNSSTRNHTQVHYINVYIIYCIYSSLFRKTVGRHHGRND